MRKISHRLNSNREDDELKKSASAYIRLCGETIDTLENIIDNLKESSEEAIMVLEGYVSDRTSEDFDNLSYANIELLKAINAIEDEYFM